MQSAETASSPKENRQQQEPERAIGAGADEPGGIFKDIAALVALIGASIRDAARLLGLETRLVVKTVFVMSMLGVVLGLVLAGLWISMTLVVAAGLYEFTGLGLTLSLAVSTGLSLVCALGILWTLKRLALRLAFPQTRLAVRSLLDEASRMMDQKE